MTKVSAMGLIEQLPQPILSASAKIARHMPKTILGLRYYKWTGKRINWTNPDNLQEYVLANLMAARQLPQTLQHYGDLADKIKVREFVKSKIGANAIPQLYGTWDNANNIDWSRLHDKFVMKTNNGCGTNIIVRNKKELNIEKAKRQLHKWLRLPYGDLTGQIHYSKIQPQILAEELLENPACPAQQPQDYKIFCFNGTPRFILYYEDRKVNGHVTPNMAFDIDWKPLQDIVLRPIGHNIPAPASLQQMIDAAKRLSQDLTFARIDFYDIEGRMYFGEITLTPDVRLYFTPQFLKESICNLQ